MNQNLRLLFTICILAGAPTGYYIYREDIYAFVKKNFSNQKQIPRKVSEMKEKSLSDKQEKN